MLPVTVWILLSVKQKKLALDLSRVEVRLLAFYELFIQKYIASMISAHAY